MTSDTDHGQLVLVVLSSEQREAFAADLERFRRPGIELRFEASPEVGIDIAMTSAPALVIVGMTIGMMEGLEFVALLLRARPDFPGKVIVLPDKGDPFPPVVQARDPATGKSTTENLDLAGIERLISALAANARPVVPEPATSHAATPTDTMPAPLPKAPSPPWAGAGVGGPIVPDAVSQAVTVRAPPLDEATHSLATGVRPGPAAGARPQAPVRTATSPAARDPALPVRSAPRPARLPQGFIQTPPTPASPDRSPGPPPAGVVQPSGSSAFAPPAKARQQIPVPGPRSQETIAVVAAVPPSPQGPSQAVAVLAPRVDESQAPAVVVRQDDAPEAPHAPLPERPLSPLPEAAPSPTLDPNGVQAGYPRMPPDREQSAPVPEPALAPWLPKRLHQRRDVAILVVVLVALGVAVTAATMFAHDSSPVPDSHGSPQSSHS